MNTTKSNGSECEHKWSYDYQIISSIKSATFDISKCENCISYKMEKKDNKSKDITISYHSSSPKDSSYFGNLGGYEPYEYFETE